jgi:hypothetical protein
VLEKQDDRQAMVKYGSDEALTWHPNRRHTVRTGPLCTNKYTLVKKCTPIVEAKCMVALTKPLDGSLISLYMRASAFLRISS